MPNEDDSNDNGAVTRLREEWMARLSGLRVPGRRRDRSLDLRTARPGGPEVRVGDLDERSLPPAGIVLAKSASRTAQWLRLDPTVFRTLTGLELGRGAHSQLQPQTREWHNAMSLVTLGFRLEQCLGTRSAAAAWLRGHNVALGSAPQAVMADDGDVQRLLSYVEGHLR